MQAVQLVNLSQLQNLGFNIMDLPGAVLVNPKTASVPIKSFDSVPKATTVVVHLKSGKHIVANSTAVTNKPACTGS